MRNALRAAGHCFGSISVPLPAATDSADGGFVIQPQGIAPRSRTFPKFLSCMADLMEVVAQLPNEGLFAAEPRQQQAILGKRFQRAKEAQHLDDLAEERIRAAFASRQNQ
jgi:hypothetical protein